MLTESDVPVWLIYMNIWGNSWYLYFNATLLYTTLHLRDKYTVLLHYIFMTASVTYNFSSRPFLSCPNLIILNFDFMRRFSYLFMILSKKINK